jgi:hypothetical protein
MRPFGPWDCAFDHHMVDLPIVLSRLYHLFWKSKLEPLVIVWIVLKVGKLLL